MGIEESDVEAVGNEIALLLSPLVRDLQSSYRACAEALGLSLREAQTVWLLGALPPPSTKQLAQQLDIDPANASTLVTRLSQRGLVDRAPAPDDRRRRVLTLTEEGREVWDRLRACMAQRGPTFGRLTPDELVAFRDLVRKVSPRSGA
jgi:DNA-binding MarR family transcriptional regulator